MQDICHVHFRRGSRLAIWPNASLPPGALSWSSLLHLLLLLRMNLLMHLLLLLEVLLLLLLNGPALGLLLLPHAASILGLAALELVPACPRVAVASILLWRIRVVSSQGPHHGGRVQVCAECDSRGGRYACETHAAQVDTRRKVLGVVGDVEGRTTVPLETSNAGDGGEARFEVVRERSS